MQGAGARYEAPVIRQYFRGQALSYTAVAGDPGSHHGVQATKWLKIQDARRLVCLACCDPSEP